MTKTLTAIAMGFGLFLAAGCSTETQAEKDAGELAKIAEIAVETCGSKDEVENVTLEGFTCKE